MDLIDIAVSDRTLAFTEVIRLGFYFLFHFLFMKDRYYVLLLKLFIYKTFFQLLVPKNICTKFLLK